MHHLALFASGTGSNARKIMDYFKMSETVRVSLVVSNNKDAGVLAIAESFGVPTHLISRKSFYDSTDLLAVLAAHEVDFIALAGFMWLVPPYLVQAFPRRILNIHPALLPKFGGKGMYGMHVHEAVQASGESESGITIHYVNERYDEGNILFQTSCVLEAGESPAQIAKKVQVLEHEWYPKVIETALAAAQSQNWG